MKFVVLDKYGESNIVEAEDIMDAVEQSYNNHYEYSHIIAVVKAEDSE